MNSLRYIANSEHDTKALGAALAKALPPGTVVALIGTLGAGKTRLVQAIAEASGVDPADVVSPTFVLVHEYHGARTIYHFDAYRLDSVEQFLALGPDEYFAGEGICLVEWADRVAGALPAEHLAITIHVEGETRRTFQIVPHGPALTGVVARLKADLPSPV
jgi:tRNA threonylcarbamoyladenosine biosynthesis protein TsaE